MLRLRRHPMAGLALLALLTPLLAAGPGMPCADADAGQHRVGGHVAAATEGGDAVGPHAYRTDLSHGHASHDVASARSDDVPSPPSPVPCTMGMLCSGTVLTPPSAALANGAVVDAIPEVGARWTLHTADPTLPRRPPRA